MRNRETSHILKKIGRAINQYSMISAGDRVVIAFSGGKDSMVMLHTLAERKKHIPIDYELTALHVTVEGTVPPMDKNDAINFCSASGVELHFIDVPPKPAVKISVCAACAIARRNAMFRFCKDNDYKIIAFGHHLNDAVETLFINMNYNSRISSMPASFDIFEGRLKIIRPLMLVTRDEVVKYAGLTGIKAMAPVCEHAQYSRRERMREIIDGLEKDHPGAAKRIFNSMGRIREEYLP